MGLEPRVARADLMVGVAAGQAELGLGQGEDKAHNLVVHMVWVDHTQHRVKVPPQPRFTATVSSFH